MGKFEIAVKNDHIAEILSHLTNEDVRKVSQVCERYSEDEEDIRRYEVYHIDTPSGKRILKKTGEREAFNYERYLSGMDFAVPHYYGKYQDGEDIWILTDYIEGNDLRDMNEQLTILSAKSLAKIQNAYWQEGESNFAEKADNRFEVYQKRIQKRFESIADIPVMCEAYQIFLDRQWECPRTLSHGDFLQFNVIAGKDSVYLIDWGFGGIMPYSLDIARFISHATENRATFPFYMTHYQKKLFIEKVYEMLDKKPDYSQYIMDINLAILNEYVEFIEAGEDADHWYYNHTVQLAKDIINANWNNFFEKA